MKKKLQFWGQFGIAVKGNIKSRAALIAPVAATIAVMELELN